MALTVKYVSMQGKAAWYTRRYPAHLLGHAELCGRKTVRKRIRADPAQNPVQFATELQHLNGQFEKTISYLNGEVDTLPDAPAPALVQIEHQQPTTTTTTTTKNTVCVSYSSLSEAYIAHTGMSEQNKRHRAHMKLMSDFSSYVHHVTMKTLRDALLAYVADHRASVAESSLSRYISIIVKPVAHHNNYARSEEQQIAIVRPRLKNARPKKPTKRKKPLNHAEQITLIDNLHNLKPWQELFVLLAIQTGANITETRQLTIKSFNFSNEVPIVCIGGEGTQKKTDERERLVPLVLSVVRIQELLGTGALDEIKRKTADNISAQLSTSLDQIVKGTTAYSLRHTLRHNLTAALVPIDIQAELGGWTGKGTSMSESHAGYGQLGKDYNERLLARFDALNKAFTHLLKL